MEENQKDYTALFNQLHADNEAIYNIVSGFQSPDLTGVQNSVVELHNYLQTEPYKVQFESLAESLQDIQKQLETMQKWQEDSRKEDLAKEADKAAEEAAAESEQPAEVNPVTPEDMQVLLSSLESIDKHLENVEVYQQNSQNIQLPILCAVSLCFGGVLALILSGYLKH